ncbi:unnamed protein product [marine sediment metagenome]|uniref:Uncharacterized protein n=1 Tax=marine sediment metagenome TaxID=412755 RepID=X1IV74_9ZZZZ
MAEDRAKERRERERTRAAIERITVARKAAQKIKEDLAMGR